MTRVKICGLCSIEDVVQALDAGADAVGFVLEPSSPRCIELSELDELLQFVGPYATTVAVYGRGPETFPRVSAIQAVEFRALPQGPLRIRAVRLKSETTVAEVLAKTTEAEALLLDAFSPNAYGGTGERVDWERAAEVVHACKKPVILAGGLTPDNVAEAIRTVRPYAVDVSSGVEVGPRVKDRVKVRDFVKAAKAAG